MDDFHKRFTVIAEKIDQNLNKMVRKVVIAADQAIVLSTPVDTGAARSNWLVGLDQPNRAKIPPYSPGQGLGAGEGANASAAMEQCQQTVAQYKNGQTVYISNNLDYIQALNEGHSAQAPAGFVEAGVQLAASHIRRTKVTEGI